MTITHLGFKTWLWLLTKQSGYRLFSHKSVVQIAEDLFAHYPYPVEWRLSNNYLALDYQVQYGESDFDFISRLLQEHGINYHFEHDSDKHTLVLSDANNHFKILANPSYQSLTVYPPHQRFPEYSEYIEHFEVEEQLTTGKVLLNDYQFKTPSLTQSAEASYHWQHAHNELLTYEWTQGDYADVSVGQPKADLLNEQQYQHGLRAYGKGRLKAMQVGHHFSVDNHPNSDSNRDWLILGLQTTITPTDPDNNTHQFFVADTQFIVQPVDQTLRPDRTIDKPIARSQTAMVVGPEGATGSSAASAAEEIHTDEYGRVKVKFHWDRPSLAQRDQELWMEILNVQTLRINIKLVLLLLSTLFISSVNQAAQSYGHALVSDKDGYVNLRSSESLQSDIIRKLPNGTVLSANCVDYTLDKNFCFIITDNYAKGYVYKDRLSFFADNRILVNVPIIKNNPLVANFSNNKHSIKASIEIKPVKVDVSKISNTNKEACPTLYKGVFSYGLNDDNQTPSNYYTFSDITFYLDNKKITVPKEKYIHCRIRSDRPRNI